MNKIWEIATNNGRRTLLRGTGPSPMSALSGWNSAHLSAGAAGTAFSATAAAGVSAAVAVSFPGGGA